MAAKTSKVNVEKMLAHIVFVVGKTRSGQASMNAVRKALKEFPEEVAALLKESSEELNLKQSRVAKALQDLGVV